MREGGSFTPETKRSTKWKNNPLLTYFPPSPTELCTRLSSAKHGVLCAFIFTDFSFFLSCFSNGYFGSYFFLKRFDFKEGHRRSHVRKCLVLSLLGATLRWQKGMPSQGWAQACQELSRRFPKSEPSQNSHKGGDRQCGLERARPAAISRNHLPLPRGPDPPVLCWVCCR